MENIDIIYMDDDFNFEDNVSNEIDDDIDVVNIEEPEIEKTTSKMNVFEETYSIIDRYNNMQNNLKKINNELNLLKIKYESLNTEYNSLVKKYDKEVIKNENNNKEIKSIRRNLMESNKSVLMLKTLLELIINKYGMDNVCKITKLNEEQINKYLNKKN